jgi:hypothetical protein
MLQQGTYDILEFTVPQSGMNQNISADVLPFDFAYLLENIIAKPLGEGQVRYGTSLVASLPNPEATIIRQFPFTKADGSKQILLYVQEYVQDLTASDFTVFEEDPYSFAFNTDHEDRYVKDTPVKVVYALNGVQTVYDSVVLFEETGGDSVYKIKLLNNAFPPEADNPVINSVWYSSASIYVYDLTSNTFSAPLKQNLAVGCIPRAVTFLNQLVLCNGVDKILAYDGTSLSEVYDFVKDAVTGLTRDGNQQLSFDRKQGEDYLQYSLGSKIQLVINGTVFQTTLTAFVATAQRVILSVGDVLPQFVPNQNFLFYQAFPPAFNFLFVAYNRLWALGAGASGIDYRVPDQAMKVYFAYKPNSLTQWFDEKTGAVPSIDLSKTHGIPDNLEAIDLVNGCMVFIGRENTQVWTGSQPAGAIRDPDQATLIYNSTLSVGMPHGDLIIDLPNDASFITKTGVQSISSLNVAKQFAATSLDAVDPLVRSFVKTILSSNREYRSCSSFKYEGGAIAGFKIGSHKVLSSLFATSLYSWSLFSGDFLRATSFLPLGDSLYLSIKNKIYRYADGNDGNQPVYGDQNGMGLISFTWTLPVVSGAVISGKGRRFANKRYEVQMDYPSSFTLLDDNSLFISVNHDLPQTSSFTTKARWEARGDRLQTIPLAQESLTPDAIGFRLAQPYHSLKDRLKFLASRFWVTLQGETNVGPVSLKRLKLYGIWERS